MKIAIIGAGICGTYLAAKLAQKGNEVIVFEKRKTVGKECCSGLFSSRLFEFIPEARPLVTNTINGCVVNFPKKTVRLNFKQPFSVIEHSQLDLLSASLASLAGAYIRVNEPVAGKRFDDLLRQYDRIVGCDGALSPTRNYLLQFSGGSGGPTPAKESRGLDPRAKPRIKFYLGVQGFEQKNDDSDLVETWATQNGFIWRIPRGQSVEWGIMEKPDIAPKLFNEFIAQKNIEIGGLKSAIIPQGLILPKNERITLCGDASGLTKPWSGGGVIWNLTQAGFLLKNFPNFIQYRQEASSFFNLRFLVGKLGKFGAYTAGYKFPWLLPGMVAMDGDYLLKK